MVILGLGSNIGDRLFHLREALRLIRQIPQLIVDEVSPLYVSDALLPHDAPSDWNQPYINLALRCQTSLSPYELLEKIKAIEILIGRTPDKPWGPRIIDIDLLAWDDFIRYDAKLHIPHEHLSKRPFALWPLADVAPLWIHPILKKTAEELASIWGSRFSGDAPLHTRQIPHRIDMPSLVGILNITPDSFSDGGNYTTKESALKKAEELIQSGANIIDIGAEATGPKAQPLNPDIEWQRLEPVLQHIVKEKSRFLVLPKISVDTRHASVAEKALALGVDWINDVSGLEDPAMRDVLSHSHCDIVFMHHLGIPVNHTVVARDIDIVQTLYHFAHERLASFNIDPSRCIFDVGIGYGKTAAQSSELLKRIASFKSLGVRLLVGHSRKSFLTQYTDRPANQRDFETQIISLALAKSGVDYLRVHDVKNHADLYKVAHTFGLIPTPETV